MLIGLKRAYTIKTNEYLKMIFHSASQLQCHSILNVTQIYIEHMLKHNETKNYCHLTMSQSTDLQIALPQQKLIDRHMRMIISRLYNGFCYMRWHHCQLQFRCSMNANTCNAAHHSVI